MNHQEIKIYYEVVLEFQHYRNGLQGDAICQEAAKFICMRNQEPEFCQVVTECVYDEYLRNKAYQEDHDAFDEMFIRELESNLIVFHTKQKKA